ncbi:GNAT family N-acetyltransferase [Bacillus sp. V3-13]|nr:GNAT family N-acetyltransferase [Bacillus sp. V3-13]
METAFEKFPILETSRLHLREVRLEDAPAIFAYFSKDEVTKYYDLASFTDEQQAVDLIKRLQQRYSTGEQIRWAVALKEQPDRLIGTCGLHAIEPEHFKAEIGYELNPDFWNKGIMAEVIQQIVDYSFKEMGLNRLEAFYDPANVASRRVLEKNGFEYEGILKKRFFEKGQFVDAAISAIIDGSTR